MDKVDLHNPVKLCININGEVVKKSLPVLVDHLNLSNVRPE